MLYIFFLSSESDSTKRKCRQLERTTDPREREFAKMRKFTLEMHACEEKKDESQVLRSVLVAPK